MSNEFEADGRALASRCLRRERLALWTYYGLFLVAVVLLIDRFGFILGLTLSVLVHLCVHVAIFRLEAESTLTTNKSRRDVFAEFASFRDPYSSLWLARADEDGARSESVETATPDEAGEAAETGGVKGAEVAGNGSGEPAVAARTIPVSELFGLFSAEYELRFEEQGDDEFEIQVRDDEAAFMTASVALRDARTRTHVELSVTRPAMSAFGLLLATLVDPLVKRYLAEHEYYLVEETSKIGVHSPFGR